VRRDQFATQRTGQLLIRDGRLRWLGENRRSVSQKAPLQNQFGERGRVRRSGVEKQRRGRVTRKSNRSEFFEEKVDIRKTCVVACPTLRCNQNNRTQNLAALHLRGLLFLLRGVGMKRAGALQVGHWRYNRHEGAMIRNCEPRTNGNRNGCGSSKIPLHPRCHARFQLAKAFGVNRPRVANAQMFSSVSTIGPMAGGIASGGMASPEASGVGLAWPNCGCSTRVANSIAVNSNTAAR